MPGHRGKPRTAEELRLKVETDLGNPLPDGLWSFVVLDGYVHGYLDGTGDFTYRDVLRRCRKLLDAWSRDVEGLKTRKRHSGASRECNMSPDKRLAALGEIWAAEAGRLPAVQAFRRKILGGQLLAPEEVKTWISRQVAEQGPPAVWVKVPLPQGVSPEHPHDLSCLRALLALPEDFQTRWPVEWSLDVLAYHSGERTSKVPVAREGTLRQLKELAAYLTALFPLWNEPQAVAFVLTGAVPTLLRARAESDPASLGPPRITMDIDARMSPDEVADFYAKARRNVLRKRTTPMTDKHLRLAVYLAQHFELSWSQLMVSWNKEYPMWAYSDARTFARDAKAAWCRVTGHGWVPRRGDRMGMMQNGRMG